jgi:hypothetical protein
VLVNAAATVVVWGVAVAAAEVAAVVGVAEVAAAVAVAAAEMVVVTAAVDCRDRGNQSFAGISLVVVAMASDHRVDRLRGRTRMLGRR